MTKLNAFAKIKALFQNENFNDAKLADGTLIQWEGELGEGTAIMVIDTDGNTTPAPDATHELSDGTQVTTVGGLVTKIEPKKEEAMEEEMAASDMAAYEERMGKCEMKIAEMEKKMQDMFTAVELASVNVDSKFNEIKEIVETIAEEPIVVAEAPKNSTFKKAKPSKSAAERIAEWKNSNI